MNDPVLQRSMFRGSQPTVAPGTPAGIRSMTTPDENAQVLRNMFRTPVAMVQPVQSFQDGGLAERLEIAVPPEVVATAAEPAPSAAPVATARATAPAEEPVPDRPIASGIRSLMNYLFPPRSAAAPTPAPAPAAAPAASVPALPPPREVGAAPGMNLPALPPSAAAPAAREKGPLELTLEGIREERARSADDRRQNALLALMQAGFATAAGASPNALTNIGAGGQAGIASFASLEKARREEQAALRRDETSIRLAQAQMRAQDERTPEQVRSLAMIGGWTPEQGREGLQAAVMRGLQIQKSMEKEPELIRTFQTLGGGDVRRGFEIYNADKKLQAAIAVTKDITASEEDKRVANEYIRNQLTQARTGGASSFPGFSARPVQ